MALRWSQNHPDIYAHQYHLMSYYDWYYTQPKK